MVSIATAAPVVGAAFIASAVEVVEAFTIVLAVSVVRGIRPAAVGVVTALAVLCAVVAFFGPMLSDLPITGLRLAVGVLLIVFGLGWLRKAVLRAGGVLPLHDEAAAFARQTGSLEGRAGDAIAALTAFKAVLLEGTEVVFIVLAIGARPGLLAPAAIGAGVACVAVLALGIALRRPMTRIPENTMKFFVGALLTAFGVFWSCEGLGAPWPGGDWAMLALVATYGVAGLALAAMIRRRSAERA